MEPVLRVQPRPEACYRHRHCYIDTVLIFPLKLSPTQLRFLVCLLQLEHQLDVPTGDNFSSLLSSPSVSPPPTLKMPTPESPLFLAKKPKVPPTFDGVDYADTPALKAAQDAIIREQWVKSMMARLIREELGKCYYKNGSNHLEKCGALRGMCDLLVHRALGGRWIVEWANLEACRLMVS